MIKRATLFILMILSLLASHVFANNKILEISEIKQTPVSITDYFGVFEDTSAKLTLVQVQQKTFQTNFPASESLNFSYTKSAYWLRLNLRNASNQTVESMLELAYPFLANIAFYQHETNGNYQLFQSGYAVTFEKRPYKNRLFVFPISLPAHSTQDIYLRIETPNDLLIPARLWEKNAFYKYERIDNSIQSLYFGMVMAMVLYNFFLFSILRERSYLLYVIFSLFSAGAILFYTGLASAVFSWFDSFITTNVGVTATTAFTFTFFLLFMRQILNTVTVAPRLDSFIKVFVGINALLPFVLPMMYGTIILMASAILVLITCVVCMFERQRSAYLFTASFACLFLVILTMGLSIFSFLPAGIASSTWRLQFGSACEMLLLAFALADRYNVLRQEKEQAQQQLVETLQTSEHILEMRVTQRTKELEIANQKLKTLSMTDGLTGLANRRHFDEVLQSEWIRAKRFKQPLSIGLLDVDWFKKYNDFYGHQMGDECLKIVARVLAENVSRTGDLVARYGGEEFVFIEPETDLKTAKLLAEKICHALDVLALPHKLSEFGHVSMSIGVATIIPNDTIHPELLLKNADVALYHAKAQGRNRVAIYNN